MSVTVYDYIQLRNKWFICYNCSSLALFILLPCDYKYLINVVIGDTCLFSLPNQVLIYKIFLASKIRI